MFGIGTGEILLILIIAMLVVGPEKMVEFAGKAGRLLAKLRMEGDKITSEFREALAVDEISEQIQGVFQEVKGEDVSAPPVASTPPREAAPETSSPPSDQPAASAPTAPKPALTRPDLSAEAEAVDLGTGVLVPEDEDVEPTIIPQAQIVQESAAEEGSNGDEASGDAPSRPANEG